MTKAQEKSGPHIHGYTCRGDPLYSHLLTTISCLKKTFSIEMKRVDMTNASVTECPT